MRLDAPVGERALVIVSPLLLVALGAWGVLGGGTIGLVVLVAGLALFVAAGWTMPWSVVVDGAGIRRRTLLRHHLIPWDDVVALERTTAARRGRSFRSAEEGTSGGGKGLVVRTVDRRRYVVTMAPERPADWDRLRELLAEHAPGVSVPSPPDSHPFNR